MSAPAMKTKRDPIKRWAHEARPLIPIVIGAFVLLTATPVAKDPPILAMVLGKKAQDLVDQLRVGLSITSNVGVLVVPYHPLVFSVEPIDKAKTKFRLSMELRFLMM